MVVLFVAIFTWIFLSLIMLEKVTMGISMTDLSKIEKELKRENFADKSLSIINRYGQFYEVISDGSVIYSSNPSKSYSFSPEELEIMLPYDTESYYTSTRYTEVDGKGRYFIQKNKEIADKYVASGVIVEEEEFVYLLDEQLNVLIANTSTRKESFTPREIGLLTQTLFDDFHVYKYDFKTNSGKKMTLVMFRPYDIMLVEQRFYDSTIFNLGILLIIVTIIIIVFTWRLNKRISMPLKVLNDAIKKLSQKDRIETVTDYNGPKELMEIFKTFNIVSLEFYNSEKKRQEVEESNQTMIANLSHDLRTPVTVIQGYSKALADNLIANETRERYTQIIYQKAVLLDELISSLFDFSQAQHPKFQLQTKTIDFCEYLRSYWAKHYDEFILQDYELEIDIPEIAYYAQLDTTSFTRALDNLLNNFLKYNPPKTRLTFTLKREKHVLILSIADNGTKISKEVAKTLFQPFVTGSPARTAGKSGAGLGLSIVKQFVIMHRGNIILRTENVAPYSKIFEITLPIDSYKK
ncbi:sensor histidine kinase [Streptococcus sp. S784/96/1]|uniref:sensor histidine kinase n=2 Tax=Streptococcus sp. S784/96/1 TaxID=2653499 RepID=UPI001389D564|nr:HAMP domain-containing sensor histidine kinase [Streptococcus sp. S784/96/1]